MSSGVGGPVRVRVGSLVPVRVGVARAPAPATLRRRAPKPAVSVGEPVEPSVGCIFCGEAIEIAWFVAGATEPIVRSAACRNCGLRVSATPRAWAAWSRRSEVSDDGLADRLRARRVATASRAILQRVGAERA